VSWLPDYQRRAAQTSAIAHYLPVLFGMAARYPGVRVIEIGTDIGESTTALLAAAELAGGHVWSVDSNPQAAFQDTYQLHGPDRLWTFACADSAQAAGMVPPDCDVLFVDSGHQYHTTCLEIELYLPKVVPGGVALFHDTDKPGTDDKVKEALNDLLPGMGLTWEEYPGKCGLGVVRVPGL
jgi:predicted O-methyltransferase YrrM